MRELICCLLVGGLGFAHAATNEVCATMSIARCQAVDKNHRQCVHPAESGSRYCWRHRGFVKAVNDWSTNVWDHTKTGAKSAWEATRDAAEEAREGIVDLFTQKDPKARSGKR